MCEFKRIIAVHIVDDILIVRWVESVNSVSRVIVIASDEDQSFRSVLANTFNAGIRDPVPVVDEAFVGDLVEKLKSDVLRISAETFCELFPKLIEFFLIFLRSNQKKNRQFCEDRGSYSYRICGRLR